jgi:hypothetical protein
MDCQQVDLASVVDCPDCMREGRGNYPVSPAVGHCRRCGYRPEDESGAARAGTERVTPCPIRTGGELVVGADGE